MRSADHRSERHAALDGMAVCPPCTGLCNQGRACSARSADFLDTAPSDDTEQLEAIRQGMPLRDMVQWVGASLLAFWAFCFIAGWIAEQASKHH